MCALGIAQSWSCEEIHPSDMVILHPDKGFVKNQDLCEAKRKQMENLIDGYKTAERVAMDRSSDLNTCFDEMRED